MSDNSERPRRILRKARLSDAGVVVDLVRALAGEMTDQQARRRFRRFVLRPSYLVFVLEESGRPIALWFGREGYFLGADLPYVQIIGLVVDPAYRGQGIASELMGACPPQNFYCQMWFTTQHEHLHGFYQGLDFVPTATRFMSVKGNRKPLPWARRMSNAIAARF